MIRIELRQAIPEDLPQVYAITEAAMRTYVEHSFGPWIEDFQRSVIGKSFNPATHRLIYAESALAGVVAAVKYGDHIQLEKFYLLPHFQRRGIGAHVLHDLQQLATREQKTVRLRVLAVNRDARRFYERHGFMVTQRTQERCFMEYPAAHGVAPCPAPECF